MRWLVVFSGAATGCYAAEASRPRPPAVHTTFPTARIAATCGVALDYGPLPEGLLDERYQALSALERRALRIEVCAARTRAEVAMATTLIGVRLVEAGDADGGLLALRHAADVWYEPMAHVELGLAYLRGDGGVPHDPARAWRYLEAGRAIAADVAGRAGDDALSRGIAERVDAVLPQFDDPATIRRFDRRAAGASTGRFAEARVAAYREVYVPGYGAR